MPRTAAGALEVICSTTNFLDDCLFYIKLFLYIVGLITLITLFRCIFGDTTPFQDLQEPDRMKVFYFGVTVYGVTALDWLAGRLALHGLHLARRLLLLPFLGLLLFQAFYFLNYIVHALIEGQLDISGPAGLQWMVKVRFWLALAGVPLSVLVLARLLLAYFALSTPVSWTEDPPPLLDTPADRPPDYGSLAEGGLPSYEDPIVEKQSLT
jgi:hypothetical protein